MVAPRIHLVLIVKPPFGIGFAAQNTLSAIIDDHPDIGHWVLSGHSLGGVAASSFASDNPAGADGLLFWASYP